MLHEIVSLCSRGVLIQTPPLLGQDCGTRAERIRSSKTAVQNAIYQRAALAHSQTCVAQASHNGAEDRLSGHLAPAFRLQWLRQGAWRRLRRLGWHGLQWCAEVSELGQMRFTLA